MASRRAITKAQALRYRSGSRTVKSEILDAVCAVTGFNQDYARRALKAALTPPVVKPRTPRPPKYDAKVVAALEKCWAVVNAPAGKRLAPILGELVPVLRQHGELDKITKNYDTATTPHAHIAAHPDVMALPKRRLATIHTSFNPAVQRQIQALCDELPTLATAKDQATGVAPRAGLGAGSVPQAPPQGGWSLPARFGVFRRDPWSCRAR